MVLDDATRKAFSGVSLVVVTIRSDDALGEQQEQALRAALARRGVGLIAATFTGDGSWRDDAAMKSSLVREVWADSGSPVLWIDPDIHPSIHFVESEFGDVDFAIHDRSRQHGTKPVAAPEFAGQFIWFGTSATVGELISGWDERCNQTPTVDDAAHLAAAWQELPLVRSPRVRWLPPWYAGGAGPEAQRGVALAHPRSLFAPPPNPYYVLSPDFNATSSGVWAVHALCHALNTAGYPAFLVGAKSTNPEWDTPLITQDQIDVHTSLGVEPIVVYPEIVTGNPLGGKVVARYVLNRPGYFTGSDMGERPNDLLFYYSEQFVDGPSGNADFLTVPTINPLLFRPDPTRTRDRTLVYQHRFPLEQIDLSLFPPGTEVLSMSNPLPLAELAELFRSTKTLYSYELSGTCTMAMACGCPVIYRTEGGMTELPSTFLFGDNGAAMCTEEGGLERATRTVRDVHEAVVGMEVTFWEQLAVFVRRTQAAADKHRK